MKRIAAILILSAGLAAGPAMADQRQNIDGAIGATIGALVGSQVAHGRAGLVTTAAGAVSGFIIGQSVAHNDRDEYRDHYRRHDERRSYGPYPPRLQAVHETFVARTTSNVRAGPGAWFRITGTVYRHEPVRVVAKVEGRDWYMIDAHGRRGFVYAPLLRPARAWNHHHWRHADQRDGGGWFH